MLHYILQVIAFQLLFLIIYDIFLRKETFFNLNRAYLLGTAILSLVIPFIKIEQIKTVVAKDFVIRLPEVIIGNASESVGSIDPEIAMQAGINLEPEPVSVWTIALIAGICIAAIILLVKISKLLWLASKHPKQWSGNLLIVKLLNSTKAFSFFHYVFLGDKLNVVERKSILEHEMVHVEQKHTLDLLFFEVLRIVFWFNPLIYIYQNRIATLHEFIADSKAVKGHNKKAYYNNLLAQVFETQQFSFVNPFFKHSLIKKRILMLSKSKSKRINIIKYTLLLPLVFTMLIYTSSYAKTKVESPSETAETVIEKDVQDLTDRELYDKYYDEIVKLYENKAAFADIYETYRSKTDNYILSRNQLYKRNALFKFFLNKDNVEGREMDTEELEDSSASKFDFQPYKEYLDYKKTDEAKEAWENRVEDGVLRLVVTDAGKMTASEEKKFKKKLDLVEQDERYKGVLVATVDGRTKMLVNTNVMSNLTSINADKIKYEKQEVEVPFAIIDEVPTFTFCDSYTTQEERKKCMSNNVSKHVNKNFNIDLAKDLRLAGRQRINVMFKINKEGLVTGIKARAPHPQLEEEAIRVIKTLPRFIPGKHKGEPVIVPYSLPIIFQVNADTTQNNETESTNESRNVEAVKELLRLQNSEKSQSQIKQVPFGSVDEVPMYENCVGLESNKDRKKCVSKEISMFVNKNFNIDKAVKLGLKGRHRIEVLFKITDLGEVTGIRARANHPELEKEAIRVLESLPKFSSPGKQDGKPVAVLYSLPIVFQISE